MKSNLMQVIEKELLDSKSKRITLRILEAIKKDMNSKGSDWYNLKGNIEEALKLLGGQK